MKCCFTGHRRIPDAMLSPLQDNLRRMIEQLYRDGVREFRCGGAIGFDTLAALAVLEKREEYPDIRLVLMLPYRGQANAFTPLQKRCYDEIMQCADEVNILSEHYFRGCMFVRNRALVEGSDYCVSFLLYDTGGTKMTVDYAKKMGLKIINLGE